MLAAGFVLVIVGSYLFGEVYFCAVNTTTGATSCPLSAADAATRIGYAIPLLMFGVIMIIPGAIFSAAGHIAEHLGPTNVSESESESVEKPPLRVCVKCGRQVDLLASYCPSCGNQLAKI